MKSSENKDLDFENRKKHRHKHIAIVLVLALATLIFINSIGKPPDGSDEMLNPIIAQFPLRGEWYSPNTPGTKIPSHGTDQLGTRYAYDFIQVDWDRKGWSAYQGSLPQYLFLVFPYVIIIVGVKKYIRLVTGSLFRRRMVRRTRTDEFAFRYVKGL